MTPTRSLVFASLALCAATAHASNPVSTYVAPAKLEYFPAKINATEVVIHGAFFYWMQGNTYSTPKCGYMYFKCVGDLKTQDMCRMQWSEIEAAIGQPQCEGFGQFQMATTATLRSEGTAYANPDTWDLGMGIQPGVFVDGKCDPARKLGCIASPPPDMTMAPRDMAVAKPDLAVPPPDLSSPKPDLTVPPADLAVVGKPDLTMPPGDLAVGPKPDLAMPPADLAVAPPDLAMAAPDLAMVPPDMAMAPPDMAMATPDLVMAAPDLMEAPIPDLAMAPKPDLARPAAADMAIAAPPSGGCSLATRQSSASTLFALLSLTLLGLGLGRRRSRGRQDSPR